MEEEIGKIKHYFSKIGVAVVEITSGSLNIGDKIHIKGKHTDFTQETTSIQIEHKELETAEQGQEIGMKVDEHVREHDVVYKVTDG